MPRAKATANEITATPGNDTPVVDQYSPKQVDDQGNINLFEVPTPPADYDSQYTYQEAAEKIGLGEAYIRSQSRNPASILYPGTFTQRVKGTRIDVVYITGFHLAQLAEKRATSGGTSERTRAGGKKYTLFLTQEQYAKFAPLLEADSIKIERAHQSKKADSTSAPATNGTTSQNGNGAVTPLEDLIAQKHSTEKNEGTLELFK